MFCSSVTGSVVLLDSFLVGQPSTVILLTLRPPVWRACSFGMDLKKEKPLPPTPQIPKEAACSGHLLGGRAEERGSMFAQNSQF